MNEDKELKEIINNLAIDVENYDFECITDFNECNIMNRHFYKKIFEENDLMQFYPLIEKEIDEFKLSKNISMTDKPYYGREFYELHKHISFLVKCHIQNCSFLYLIASALHDYRFKLHFSLISKLEKQEEVFKTIKNAGLDFIQLSIASIKIAGLIKEKSRKMRIAEENVRYSVYKVK